MAVVRSYDCFLIGRMPSHGKLLICQDSLTFEDGSSTRRISLPEITEVKPDVRLHGIMRDLDVATKVERLHFTGLHGCDEASGLIEILMARVRGQVAWGFAVTKTKNTCPVLANPTLLVSQELPTTPDRVMAQVEGALFGKLLASSGNEGIVESEWRAIEAWRDRSFAYQKTVDMGPLGRRTVSIKEIHRLWRVSDRKFVMELKVDLGRTPYASCFDPQVQLHIETTDAGTVLLQVFLEMIWSSSPLVKGIIATRTTEETKAQWVQFTRMLQEALGCAQSDAADAAPATDDDFRAVRIGYKVAILVLIMLNAVAITWKRLRYGRLHPPIVPVAWNFRIVVVLAFTLLLLFF